MLTGTRTTSSLHWTKLISHVFSEFCCYRLPLPTGGEGLLVKPARPWSENCILCSKPQRLPDHQKYIHFADTMPCHRETRLRRLPLCMTSWTKALWSSVFSMSFWALMRQWFPTSADTVPKCLFVASRYASDIRSGPVWRGRLPLPLEDLHWQGTWTAAWSTWNTCCEPYGVRHWGEIWCQEPPTVLRQLLFKLWTSEVSSWEECQSCWHD